MEEVKNCDVMELLPFFLDVPVDSPRPYILPSQILYELQMPLQKRLDQLSRTTRKRRMETKINTFTKNPDIIVFQNFENNKTYKANITFINAKKISRIIRVSEIDSPFFDLICPESDFTKVAPGMAYTVTVSFNPTEMRDYVTKLVCQTNDETIFIPVFGLGPRPLCSIEDEVNLMPTAIRVTSEKSIFLHNFGTVWGEYKITVEEPFKVNPNRGVLRANETLQLKVSCTPIITNKLKSEILVVCNDIIFKIPVACELTEAQIYLETNSIDFTEIFIGLQDYKIITVHNKSPFCIDFRWKLLSSEKDEIEKIKDIVKDTENIIEFEKMKYNTLEHLDVINGEGHQRIIDYKFREFCENTNEELKLLYNNAVFEIIPLEGNILPNASKDFNIIFKPQKANLCLSTAFLDVTGKEDRFLLYLSGIGRGPYIVFNVHKLNIGNIFFKTAYEYEIVVKNEGCIPGVVNFEDIPTEFGGEIVCKPLRHHVKYNQCKTFVIKFTSNCPGPFVEKVCFRIEESQEQIYFLLTGTIICPKLEASLQKLEFGEVAYGSELMRHLILCNKSRVPIDFQIKVVETDVSGNILDRKRNVNDFLISPTSKGVVYQYSNVEIMLKILAHNIPEIQQKLVIEMYCSDTHKLEIPVLYTTLIPVLTCEPQEINITNCFVNFEYKRVLKITNTSSVCGYLTYTPLTVPENMDIVLNPIVVAFNPNDVFNIELTIKVKAFGLIEHPLMFSVMGSSEPIQMCKLACNGTGPIVSFYPINIYLGRVTLLVKAYSKISITNDSPIPAKVSLRKDGRLSGLCISLTEFEIPPECGIDIDVMLYLTEGGHFSSQIVVEVENGSTEIITIHADGVGYPLLFNPKLDPEFNLGYRPTHVNNTMSVSISNFGKKPFELFWSRKIVKGIKDYYDQVENQPYV